MAARNFAGGAAASTLNGGIASGDTTIVVTSGSTWPTGSASYVIDRGLAGEEKILATRSGNTLTATSRGYDGTTAAAHTTGAAIEHVGTATDFQEANDHVQATTGHGATGAVVGTTNTQTLTNKTLTAPTVADFTNAQHTHASAAQGGTNFATTADIANVAAVEGAGTATTLARGDHAHALPGLARVSNVGTLLVGSAPTVASTQFLWQAATTVITYTTGGNTITFPTAFPTGLVTLVAVLGDDAATVIVPVNASTTLTGFKIKVFDMVGAEVGAGGGYRINWMALGF